MRKEESVKNYSGIHWTLRNKFKKPESCQKCKKKSSDLDWANITGVYDRDIKNYQALCSRCHMNYDLGKKDGFCFNGHALTEENTYRTKYGREECGICKRSAMEKYNARRRLCWKLVDKVVEEVETYWTPTPGRVSEWNKLKALLKLRGEKHGA